MLPSFDKLSKMLTQEKRLGYKNKAILGGLEKLVPNWGSEARQEAANDEERTLIAEIVQDLGAILKWPKSTGPILFTSS